MRSGRFVLTSIARGIGQGLKCAAAARREVGSCGVTLISTQPSCGQTTTIYQVAETQGYLVADVHADPNARTLVNSIHKAVFGDESVMYGSDQTFGRIVRELRTGASAGVGGPFILHNGDRLSAKLIDVLLDFGDSTGFHMALCGGRRLRELIMSATSGALEKLRSRIILDLDLPGPSLSDARLLGEELAEVRIEADLIEHCFKQAGTSVRSLLVQFRAIDEAAAVANLESIGLTRWLALSGESEQPKLATPRQKAIAAPAATGRAETAANMVFKGASKVA